MTLVVPTKPGQWPEPVFTATPSELGNPGDTSLESANAFNKRTNVPVTEERGITPAQTSLLVGPTSNPATGSYPAEYWRNLPPGDPANVPTPLKETGWEPKDIVAVQA